jgi:hypothetical protein
METYLFLLWEFNRPGRMSREAGRGCEENPEMNRALKLLTVGALALLLTAPALAAVDAEVELRYWANDTGFEFSGEPEESNGMPGSGLRADIAVFKRLAFAGEYYSLSGEDDFDGLDSTQAILDVKWRIIAPAENTFFGLGLGYQKLEYEDEDGTFDSDGFRIVADGRFGFVGILYVYGRLGYLPSLSDIEMDGQTFAEGDSGFDLDIGLGIEPLPILSLWVGYRTQNFDFSEPGGSGSLTVDNTGAYVGAGVHF